MKKLNLSRLDQEDGSSTPKQHQRSIEHNRQSTTSSSIQDTTTTTLELEPLSPIITHPNLLFNNKKPGPSSPPSSPSSSSSSSSAASHNHLHPPHQHQQQQQQQQRPYATSQFSTSKLSTNPPITHSSHPTQSWKSDTKNFRIQGWDPILIISQILAIQALHYILLSILIPPLLYLFAHPVPLEYEGGSRNVAMIIDWRAMVGSSTLQIAQAHRDPRHPIPSHLDPGVHHIDGWAGFGKLPNSLGRKPFRFGNRLPNISLDSGRIDERPDDHRPTDPRTPTTPDGRPPQAADREPSASSAHSHPIRSPPPPTSPRFGSSAIDPSHSDGLLNKLQVGLGPDWVRDNLNYSSRNYELYHDSNRSWVISIAWFSSSMIGVLILYEIVRRPKQIMDHSLTICSNHLILTTYYSSRIPSSIWFYFVLLSSSVVQIILTEQLCVRREFRDGLGVAWKVDQRPDDS